MAPLSTPGLGHRMVKKPAVFFTERLKSPKSRLYQPISKGMKQDSRSRCSRLPTPPLLACKITSIWAVPIFCGRYRIHQHVWTYQEAKPTAHCCMETGGHDTHCRDVLAVFRPSAYIDSRYRFQVFKALGEKQ